MQQYIIRVFKYAIYFALILTFLLCIVFYTSDHGNMENFWELIPAANMWKLGIFLTVFAFIYPIVGFSSRKVYLNTTFQEDRADLINCLLVAKYEIISEDNDSITFRSSSKFIRMSRLFEDKVTLDYSDNPIVLKGMRRDIHRFARSMEYIIQKQQGASN